MPASDFVEVRLEESPVHENAITAGFIAPNRLATQKLYLPVRTTRLGIGRQDLDRSDEMRGYQGVVADAVESYDPDGAFSARAYAKALTWLFSLAGMDGVHTAGDGVITDPDAATIPVNAHRWVFSKRTNLISQTAQVIENFSAVNAGAGLQYRGNGYALSRLGGNMAGELTGDWVGMVLKRLAVDAVTTPVVGASSLYPFLRGNIYLSWLAGGARLTDFTWDIANPIEAVHSAALDPASYYADSNEATNEWPTMTGTVPKRDLTAAEVDALIAGTTFAAKARWKSTVSIGATAYKYSLWIEMPAVQLSGGDHDDAGNVRRRGATYNWKATLDEATGYDFRCTLVNAEAAIATYA